MSAAPQWWQPTPGELAYRAETARQARILAEIEEREALEALEAQNEWLKEAEQT